MIVYTVQLAKWRTCEKLGIPLLDTTTKSGNPLFAPGWDIVMDVKSNKITPEQYTEVYLERMRQSYRDNPKAWHDCIAQPTVAVACYCAAGKFCHRHLLVDIFGKLCNHLKQPFEYKGELQ